MKLRFHWWLNKFSGGSVSAYGIHTPPWVFWVLLGCGLHFYHLPPTLSSSFLGLPSWSVSRLQPPDVSSVWVACAFYPSHHPSLAEPPTQVLPWLGCLDLWAFTDTKQSEKGQSNAHSVVQIKWEKRHNSSPSHSISLHLLTLDIYFFKWWDYGLFYFGHTVRYAGS